MPTEYIKMDMSEVMKEVSIKVVLKGGAWFDFRIWIAGALINLAVVLLGARGKVEIE